MATDINRRPIKRRKTAKPSTSNHTANGAELPDGNQSAAATKESREQSARWDRLRQMLEELRSATPDEPPPAAREAGFVVSKQLTYEEMVARLRRIVTDRLPAQATIVVVSKGDAELLKLGGQRAWHFPRNPDGVYAGHYPVDSAAAIGHLEALRSQGADYLAFPASAAWWLDFYTDFRRHLEQHYRLVVDEDEICRIYAIRQRTADPNAGGDERGNAELLGADGDVPTGDDFSRQGVSRRDARGVRRNRRAAPHTCGDNGKPIVFAAPDETLLRIELAQSLIAARRRGEAHEVLVEGLRHDPDSARLRIELMKLEQRRNNVVAAAQLAAEALALAPNDYDVNFEIARAAWERRDLRVTEERLERLVELYPHDSAALCELVKLYCSRLEGRPTDRSARDGLLGLARSPARMRLIPAEAQLLAAETLAAADELDGALDCLRSALRRLTLASTAVQDFIVRLLRPAVSERASVPWHDPRVLASFLTHLGNGFAAVRQMAKARMCQLLATVAAPEALAPHLNLGFMAMAERNAAAALEHFSAVKRVLPEESAQVCWPATADGVAWPRGSFNLAAAFDAFKPAGVEWPKITVVTPSFNQAEYVEETLLSVLNQQYPNLEYLVVDGGSTDGSVEILRRYEPRLAKLIVEPDRGQTDAINKGLRASTGELITWINSDDMLAPGALFMLAAAYLGEDADLVFGFCFEHSDRRFQIINLPSASAHTFNIEHLGDLFHYWLNGHFFYQPETAFSRRILEQAGGSLRDDLHYTMDYEFWCRCARLGARLAKVHWPIALFRKHEQQKTADLGPTIIEQASVRDGFMRPKPQFARRLQIAGRLRAVLDAARPRVTVVSTRASRIFSDDTARQLMQTFASEGIQTVFLENPREIVPGDPSLVVALIHIYKEHEALRKLREEGHAGPIVGWFWDNHHHVFDNYRSAVDLDICIPGHGFAGAYLRSAKYLHADPLPLCVTQWTEDEAAALFERFGQQPRSDSLYGGFTRYAFAQKRNRLVDSLQAAGMQGVYFLEEAKSADYFARTPDDRFQNWAKHKTSLCLPLSGDLSQRLFDALLTGQVPIAPDDVYDLDTVIPPDAQRELPIIRLREYTVEAVAAAHQKALTAFKKLGRDGVERRHRFALENHMFTSRLRTIVSMVKSLVK